MLKSKNHPLIYTDAQSVMYLLHRNYVVKHLNEDTVVLPQWENEKMKFTEDQSMNMKKMKTSHLKIQNIIRFAINILKVSTTYHLLFCPLYKDFVLHVPILPTSLFSYINEGSRSTTHSDLSVFIFMHPVSKLQNFIRYLLRSKLKLY